MKSGWFVALAMVVGMGGTAQAEDAAPATPDKIYARTGCVACHGKEGKKAIQAYPILAGQSAAYMLAQMKDIKEGKRTGAIDPTTKHARVDSMKGVMHLVDDAQMKQLAEWLAGVEPPAPLALTPPTTPERLAQGTDLYNKNCKSCHGADGLKPLPGNPILGGQKKDYLVLQMKDIKNGDRKNGKSGTMVSFVKKLSDDEMVIVAEYLSQIPRAK